MLAHSQFKPAVLSSKNHFVSSFGEERVDDFSVKELVAVSVFLLIDDSITVASFKLLLLVLVLILPRGGGLSQAPPSPDMSSRLPPPSHDLGSSDEIMNMLLPFKLLLDDLLAWSFIELLLQFLKVLEGILSLPLASKLLLE
jgi:hypothetical protein